MHRIDDSKFLLFIEPKKEDKLTNPIDDNLTSIMKHALEKAKHGASTYSNLGTEAQFQIGGAWKGIHYTDCGERSENYEYLLENGMITNSLAVFYLQYYRRSIPGTEMKKVLELAEFYGVTPTA